MGALDSLLSAALEEQLGATPTAARALGGGDINEAYRVTLADGRVVFVKTHRRSPRNMFQTEARGLDWLRDADALRIPKVLAVAPAEGPQFLALEMLERSRPVANFDELLGRGLAKLHQSGANGFGLDHDNYIGPLPQDNSAEASWPAFYRERRLGPQLRSAMDAGLAPSSLQQSFERLFGRLDDLVGSAEPPARLHGDLWGGNLHVDEQGQPCLIDPAVYGGHREMDLAMMRLFGGFSTDVFDAYREAYPLSAGYEDRTDLYQLYPLMVHVNVFGGSYVGSVQRVLRRYT